MFSGEVLSLHQEVVTSLMLNAKYEVIGREIISKGGIVTANVEPRDVFRPAVKRGATGIILTHNHPSGDPTPSEDDIYTTKQMSQCGELIGIKLVDHIIIGHGRYTSMRDVDLMEFGEHGKSKCQATRY
jgi:DNA repair protein RadC